MAGSLAESRAEVVSSKIRVSGFYSRVQVVSGEVDADDTDSPADLICHPASGIDESDVPALNAPPRAAVTVQATLAPQAPAQAGQTGAG